jgi:ParB family chromosome partitioning protein
VGSIVVNPYQPRGQFDEESLSALTSSIREVGVLQPVLVRPRDAETFELIAGERRWRAAKRAGLRSIPAIVRDVEDLGSLEQALVENLHRDDLGALEEAAAYAQLIEDFGLTQDAVAQRVGKSRPTVANALRLLQLPAAVQALLVEGRLTAGHARALLGLASRQQQDQLARRIVAEDLTVREVEQIVRGASASPVDPSGRHRRGPGPKPAAILEVESLLGELLSTRVTVSVGDRKGKLVIDFADLDDLQRIFSVLHDGSVSDDAMQATTGATPTSPAPWMA